jgi:hypothetical protein
MARFTPNERSAMYGRARALLRLKDHANAFPYPADDEVMRKIVESTIEPRILHALRTLSGWPYEHSPIVDTTYKVRLGVVVPPDPDDITADASESSESKIIPFTMNFEHTVPFPVAAATILVVREGNEYYNDIMNWAKVQAEFINDVRIVRSLLSHLEETVNTPGQLARVWPEFKTFLPGRYMEMVAKSARASRLPETLDAGYVVGCRRKAMTTLAKLSIISSLEPSSDPKIVCSPT